jgi:D-sedoheptulose 7-phosphate isomerase
MVMMDLPGAQTMGTKIGCVIGRDGAYAAGRADACAVAPTVNAEYVTPHSEANQAMVRQLGVSHPTLKANRTKGHSLVGSMSPVR